MLAMATGMARPATAQPIDHSVGAVGHLTFTEYTVQTDAGVQVLSSQNQLPFATIGRQYLAGFASEEWRQYLDAAAYPQTSTLPANYRQTPARALAPTSGVTPSHPAGLSF